MRSKFILTVAASLLAGTMFAAAQQSGAPAGEKDRSGQPADSSQSSAQPQAPGGTQGQGSGNVGGAAARPAQACLPTDAAAARRHFAVRAPAGYGSRRGRSAAAALRGAVY